MTSDLENYIKKLKIKSYHLSNGVVLIGKFVKHDKDTVIIRSAFSLEPLLSDSGEILKKMIPAVPGTLDEEHTINKSHVVMESDVDVALKKYYTDMLLLLTLKKYNITEIQSSDLSNNSKNQTNPEVDYPFKNRWDVNND